MKCLVAYALIALAGLLALPARAQDNVLSPLVDISQPNPVGTCDDGFRVPGFPIPLGGAAETMVVVNPVHPNNIVAAWIQAAQNIIAGVSLDGGRTWQRVPIPFTLCSGGPFLATTDPQLSFAPNGDLYAIANVGNSQFLSTRDVGVSKSTDGGFHWSPATVVTDNIDLPPDLPLISADPTDARLVYATWDGTSSGHRGPGMFLRSSDGGQTWEAPSAIIPTGPQSFVQFSQVLVLPNGTLVDIFELVEQQPNKTPTLNILQLLRSTDHGQNWSAPINAVTMTPLLLPSGNTLTVDPETGQVVQDSTNPSFAIDRQNGNLYAVWEDGRFSNFQYNDIALSMSADGGFTWSTPIRVNQTPLNIPLLDRQAFLPTIAVAGNGTIGVSYYDFRFNDPSPGLPTDRWLVQCQPTSTTAASDTACWGNEVRLTNSSFNMEAILVLPAGFFVGDYLGLAGAGDAFVAVFSQLGQNKVTSVFARRIGP